MRHSVADFIAERAARLPEIKRVLLFGSRARGDAQVVSDYDVAVETTELSRERWARFALEVEEEAPTLCGVDLVWLSDSLSPEFRRKIVGEGKVIYERKGDKS